MSQPPEQQPHQPQQWWQPPANPANQQQGGQATGPHSGQWQQADPNAAATGSYTGQWQQSAQPGVTGSFSGPWQQTGAPAPGTGWQQPGQQQPAPQQDWQAQQQIPGTPPQGQYGGGFQPAPSSQYGGLGAFGGEPAKKPKASKKTLLIGGIAAAVVVAGGVGAWLLGAFAGDTLDQKSVQDGVVRVLNENYGEPDVKNAECPSGQPVENGTTFDCSVELSGQPKKVTVRVLNTTPEFEVGAPR